VEELASGDPEAAARENAARKAREVARPGATVVGADTIVALGGEILDKPADVEQAREWLARLSGRTHQVLGGLCVVDDSGERSALAVTEVDFRPLSPALVDWYLTTGEWRDRAGGYAIQGRGAALVEGIEGDYWNVVGLPVPALLDLAPGLLG
jgi:septum formation protein